MARRAGKAWNRTDSLLVLASYLDRPRHLSLPPMQERERVANIIGHAVEEVTQRARMFAALDPNNPSDGSEPGERENRLWQKYDGDRLQCMVDAEEAASSFKRRPRQRS